MKQLSKQLLQLLQSIQNDEKDNLAVRWTGIAAGIAMDAWYLYETGSPDPTNPESGCHRSSFFDGVGTSVPHDTNGA